MSENAAKLSPTSAFTQRW